MKDIILCFVFAAFDNLHSAPRSPHYISLIRHLGYERVLLTDAPLHIQGDVMCCTWFRAPLFLLSGQMFLYVYRVQLLVGLTDLKMTAECAHDDNDCSPR